MFHKIRFRLTVLSAGITVSIMIVMSLCYLYVSENGLFGSRTAAFTNEVNTFLTNLSGQTVLSHNWLSQSEKNTGFLIFLVDNQVSYLFNEQYHSQEIITVMDDARNAFAADGHILPPSGIYRFSHEEFAYDSVNKVIRPYLSVKCDYQAAVAEITLNGSALNVHILYSLDGLKDQIYTQRFLFLLIDLAAGCLLTVFAWIFTGRLLRPVEESQRRLTDFIAAASHELRTPLAVILASTDACEKAPLERKPSFLHNIRSEGERMQALLTDMLSLAGSRLSDGRSSRLPDKCLTEMDTLVLNVYEAFEPIAREKGLAFDITLPDESVLSVCDAGLIRQVLSSLINNAFTYTGEGGTVRLSLGLHNNCCLISVSDTGCGISPEDKKRVFERFYRAEASRSDKSHFGLGLYTASEIISAHKGNIGITDNKPCGTVFTVRLPV